MIEKAVQELFDDMVRSEARKSWPRCRACEAAMSLGSCGFVCGCGGSGILPWAQSGMYSPQLNFAALRRIFPERCI